MRRAGTICRHGRIVDAFFQRTKARHLKPIVPPCLHPLPSLLKISATADGARRLPGTGAGGGLLAGGAGARLLLTEALRKLRAAAEGGGDDRDKENARRRGSGGDGAEGLEPAGEAGKGRRRGSDGGGQRRPSEWSGVKPFVFDVPLKLPGAVWVLHAVFHLGVRLLAQLDHYVSVSFS